jgi:uncharacterized protein with FMN-binding domain
MKRALLIAGGTVGGLGAVLAITPPQLGSTSAINIAGAPVTGTGTTAVASASSSSSTTVSSTKTTTAATKAAKPVATKKAASGNSGTSNSATTAPAADAPATQAPAASPTAINGTFTGPSVNVNYGNVQVKITVVNGRITDAVAVKAPTGKNDRYTNMAVPVLKQQTLKAQSANIQGVSGASYTSYGWFTSLQGAIALAGL